MPTPHEMEGEHTLATAVDRYDVLRRRELEDGDDGAAGTSGRHSLELLALSEAIVRKASYGRQLTIRSARSAGASWSQIGEALGTSKQSAWEGHTRWIEDQAAQHALVAHEGFDEQEAAAARALAGPGTGPGPGPGPGTG